jgi:hypothetical protein
MTSHPAYSSALHEVLLPEEIIAQSSPSYAKESKVLVFPEKSESSTRLTTNIT